jgi:hypothetical protein
MAGQVLYVAARLRAGVARLVQPGLAQLAAAVAIAVVVVGVVIPRVHNTPPFVDGVDLDVAMRMKGHQPRGVLLGAT